MKIPAGNIYSGDPLRAVFTAPTEIAKWKGNLVHSYPVTARGRVYKDAEAAYQHLANGYKADTQRCYQLCIEITICKLQQHPRIFKAIKDSGGAHWIESCSHWVGSRKKNPGRWEGDGQQSGFIRCLGLAFLEVDK